jgi:general secretion pathway protein F
MPQFQWQGLSPAGKAKKGKLEAESLPAARKQLIKDGITPMDINEQAVKERTPLFTRGISTKNLANITRQIATLIEAGLPLESALSTMIRQIGKGAQQQVLHALHSRLTEGLSFAQSMETLPRAFPDFYVSSAAAGEKSGTLGKVMIRLADYLKTSHETGQKITTAMIYPIMISVVAVIVITALLVFVVPTMVQTFEDIGQELPPLTVGLIAVSNFLVQWGWLIMATLSGGGVVFASMMRQTGFKTTVHRLVLRLPLYGRLLRQRAVSRFIRTFGILLESRVDFVEAMSIAARVVSILPIRDALTKAVRDIREGQAVYEALETTGYFSPLVLNLIASGEKSGSLATMLDYGAEHQDNETSNTINIIVSVLPPLMAIVMGGIVLLIVLAILVPVFEMGTGSML